MTQGFHERFSISVGQDEARRRFINRCLNTVFGKYFDLLSVVSSQLDFVDRERLAASVASALGERYVSGNAATLVARSFPDCLLGLEAIYSGLGAWPSEQRFVDETIRTLLAESELDLGVRWNGSVFTPAGAEELDEHLVDEPLRWISAKDYESVRSPYEKALKHYLQSLNDPEKLADVITDLYESVEALAKIVTGRQNKDLSANAELFIAKIAASDAYKPILRAYVEYANQYRHAASELQPREMPERDEVESFLYLTGVIVRLAMSADP